MISRDIFLVIAAAALFAIPIEARAAPVDSTGVWSLLEKGQCGEARTMIEKADNVASYLDAPEGKSLYAKSICCSRAADLSAADIDKAQGYLAAARTGFHPLENSMSEWLDDAKAQCDETRSVLTSQSLDEEEMLRARQGKSYLMASYSGKVMGECGGGNLSPMLVPDQGGVSADHPSWSYVIPAPQSGALRPDAGFLDAARSAYVGASPRVAICAPFVALSDNEDPAAICAAAHDFLAFFSARYGARHPPVWTTIYHYPQLSQQLYKHAAKTTGEISCQGVLGFFDWRRQSIVFGAPQKQFGTFQHELAHDVMFWDVPLAPRWFDEGLAALYENTDRNYKGLENPWRQLVLHRLGIGIIDRGEFDRRVLTRSVLEFEGGPMPASVAREFMRHLQDCGDLPRLYRDIRSASRRKDQAVEQDPEHQPDSEQTRQLGALIDKASAGSECR